MSSFHEPSWKLILNVCSKRLRNSDDARGCIIRICRTPYFYVWQRIDLKCRCIEHKLPQLSTLQTRVTQCTLTKLSRSYSCSDICTAENAAFYFENGRNDIGEENRMSSFSMKPLNQTNSARTLFDVTFKLM